MNSENMSLNIQHHGELSAQLDQLHRAAFHPGAHPLTVLVPDYSGRKMSTENLKLTAALALIITMMQCLTRHYDGKSGNQKKKAEQLEQKTHRVLKRITARMSDDDILRIGAKIEVMNKRLGFENQPSWIVYLSLCIAILSDAFSGLKRTKLSAFDDELETLLNGLQELHDYLSKKEKALAGEFDARGTELYQGWDSLF